MMRFDKALRAWGKADFETVLKQELVQCADHLPLQQGLTHGNYVADHPVTVAINSIAESREAISIKAGIF